MERVPIGDAYDIVESESVRSTIKAMVLKGTLIGADGRWDHEKLRRELTTPMFDKYVDVIIDMNNFNWLRFAKD